MLDFFFPCEFYELLFTLFIENFNKDEQKLKNNKQDFYYGFIFSKIK